MNKSPVAIVGLGLMGEVYARRLLDADAAVIGFDVDPARRARLAEIGGRPVQSIAELAKPARCIIIAVFSTDQVEDAGASHLLLAEALRLVDEPLDLGRASSQRARE